jgi:hypothetical protein
VPDGRPHRGGVEAQPGGARPVVLEGGRPPPGARPGGGGAALAEVGGALGDPVADERAHHAWGAFGIRVGEVGESREREREAQA